MTKINQPVREQRAPALKPWIADIKAYVPGKSQSGDGRKLIKLSANENLFGCSPQAIEARLSTNEPWLYPDPDSIELRQEIGAVHGIDPQRIVCGTGSGELLIAAANAYAGPGDEVLYVRYGFTLYDIAARRSGATPVEAPDSDYGADVDKMLACVHERTKVIFLANPNNPTGTFTPRDELARLHAALPDDVLLVVDQAYAEYVEPDDDDGALALAARYPNVLVTRTFSKAYGLAGERVGWGTGHPDIVAALNRLRGAFPVNKGAQAAALAALRDQDFLVSTRRNNRVERDRLGAAIEAMGNHGLRAVPSEANFILVLFEGALTAAEAHEGLMERGYAVRHLPGQGLPHALRITIGTPEQMDDIAAALREMAERAR